MSHTVPDWDRHGGELDAIVATTDFLAPVNGKLDPGEVHAQWMGNDGHVSTGGRGGGRGRNPHWQPNCPNEWSSGGPGGGHGESEDGVTPSKPRSASPDNKGDDDSSGITVPVVDNTMALNPHDEMIMWLHQGPDEPPPRFDVSSVYALDETLEKSYCSPFFGELPDSNMSNLQSIRDSVAGQSPPGGRSSRNHPLLLPPNTQTNNASLNRAASADAALAMGAGRAAGVLPHQTGVEAFNKVRTMSTTQQPFISGKSWSSPYGNPNNSNHVGKTSRSPGTAGAGAAGSVPRTSLAAPPPAAVLPPPMLPPRSQPISLQPVVQTGPSNFSYFSRPAALMKANLQCLGVSQGAGVGANRLKIPARAFDGTTSSGSSIAESTTTRQQSGGAGAGGASGKGIDVPVDGGSEGGQQQSLGTESSWPSSMQNSLSSKDAEAADHVDSGCAETRNNSGGGVTSPAAKTPGATDKYVSPGEGVQDAPEPTLTSSSGGSGYSADRGKGVASTGKRRAREPEESECQSDDAEEEVIELKKPQQRGGTAKRTRAAEVHNLSERRRRDRINERMKALQELIPNSNKTDKASMLDEAIEYLKMLQIQLQMMSMRSGMSIPPLIPAGLQHLQMPQMGPMGPMGMGMGMGPMVGMGMGMLDMNSMAAGRPSHLMPHPSHGGTSHSGSPMMPHPSHGGASYSVSQMMHHPPLGGPLYNVSPMMPHPSHGGSQHSVSATSPAVPMVDSHDLRLQSNSALESVYLARQHPLQLTAQNMDVYNAYMMHQQHQHQHSQHHQQQHHHQQQQQPQQLLQQPQQQHQPNHMPNMGSGGPPQ